jgi:hypothetical protein
VRLSIGDLTQILRCPAGDSGQLQLQADQLVCLTCGQQFVIKNEIAILLKEKNDN